MTTLLGLDLGTTNVKALLTDSGGAVLAVASAPVPLHYVGADGVEQDIEEIWRATLTVIGRLAADRDLSDVAAVGVSSQAGAMQILDASFAPVGPVLSWLDGRAKTLGRRLVDELGVEWFTKHIGHGGFGIAAVQLLRPELLAEDCRVGFVGDVIVSRLCGRGAHDATSLSLALLYNPTLDREDDDLLARLGVRRDQLPDLLPASESAGGLTAVTAEATGLPEGVPVSAAIHDQYAAAVGCGCVHAGDVMFGAGTAWVLLAVTDRLGDSVFPSAFLCRHVVDGLFGHIVSMGNGGSSLTWALQTLGLEGGIDGGKLDEMLASVEPGADGLRFRPFLASTCPAGVVADTAGRLDGLRLCHSPAHVLRSVVEGLAFELTRYVHMLTAAGVAVERLVMCGPAAGSAVTPQIIADATGLPVACNGQPETAALGAAIIARRLAEPNADLRTLTERMTPPVRNITPGENDARYRALFDEYLASLPSE